MRLSRLHSWAAAVVVTAAVSLAHADTPRIWVRVVMPEAGQALIYDGATNQYRLIETGSRVGRYTVQRITDEHVTMTRRGTDKSYVFPAVNAPPEFGRGRQSPAIPKVLAPEAVRAGAHAKATPPPQNSLAAALFRAQKARAESPRDPYAAAPRAPRKSSASDFSTTSSAPRDPYANKGAPVSSPPSSPRDPYASLPTPGQAQAVQSGAPRNPYGEAERPPRKRPWKTVRRNKLESAVLDFDRLQQDIAVDSTPSGFKLTKVRRRSFFYKLGFRRGDVLLSVNGAAVRTIDDAAALYGDLSTKKHLRAIVKRRSRRVMLRFRIK